eukprot:Gb_16697 [translate_table: standard]
MTSNIIHVWTQVTILAPDLAPNLVQFFLLNALVRELFGVLEKLILDEEKSTLHASCLFIQPRLAVVFTQQTLNRFLHLRRIHLFPCFNQGQECIAK